MSPHPYAHLFRSDKSTASSTIDKWETLVTSLSVFVNTDGSNHYLHFARMIDAEEFQIGSPKTLDDKWELLIERIGIIADKEIGWEDGNMAEVILGSAGDRYYENSGRPE
jgi:hypothetical protein